MENIIKGGMGCKEEKWKKSKGIFKKGKKIDMGERDIHMKLKNHPNGKFFKNHGVCNSPVIGREHYPAYHRDWIPKKSSLRESGRFCSTSYNSLKKHGASLPPRHCLPVQSNCPCSFKNNRLRILMRACKILESDLGTEILLWTLVKCSLPQIVS